MAVRIAKLECTATHPLILPANNAQKEVTLQEEQQSVKNVRQENIRTRLANRPV
jgi:hypothetical protein